MLRCYDDARCGDHCRLSVSTRATDEDSRIFSFCIRPEGRQQREQTAYIMEVENFMTLRLTEGKRVSLAFRK